MIPKPLANLIISVVTVVWALNFAAQFVIADYQSDAMIHTVFMSIVGGALALSRKKKTGEGEAETDDADTE